MQTLIESTRAYALMKNEKQRDALSHAYLLVSADEKNLRSIMKAFAKILFCCHQVCDESQKRIARLIDEEHFSDCLFFPEEGKKLMVEDVEKITEESTLKPVEGEEKTFVISDFALATPAAQNKLLKLLEEPPKGVRFLLGTTSSFAVLSTVLSRVKTLEIPPFSEKEVEACLQRQYAEKYSPDDYRLCAAASGGIVGDAQSMLTGGAFKSVIDEAFSLALAKEWELPLLIKKVGETKRKKELLSLLRTVWRDATLIKTANEKGEPSLKKSVLLQSELPRLETLANARTLSALVFAQEAVSKAEKQVAFNAYFPQCLEVLMASVLRENQRNW